MTAAEIDDLGVVPLAPAIGAEVRGIDLGEPLEDARFRALERLWLDRSLLLFRDQNLSVEQQVAFGARFGEVMRLIKRTAGATDHPAILLISNLQAAGKPIGELPKGAIHFHSDQCFTVRPAKATMLYAVEVPSAGGNTLYASTIRAYETLPERLKRRIGGRRALNVYDLDVTATRREDNPESGAMRCVHPIVRTHPETGRRALYVNRLMTQSIEGMERGESDRLLGELFDHQERPEFRYEHRWRPGDLIIWDNRAAIHGRTDFDPAERRLLRRLTLAGDRPF